MTRIVLSDYLTKENDTSRGDDGNLVVLMVTYEMIDAVK